MTREGENLQVVIGPEEIARRVRELGAEISAFYGDEPVVVVCVLKGAFMFFADIVRAVNCPLILDFVRLSSYGDAKDSSGRVLFTKDMEVTVKDRHVLIVEDIVDSGRSLDYLLRVLSQRGPKSLKSCALIDKAERREVQLTVDFPGFHLKKGFVVGYGLDHAERYRELPGIYEVIS